MKKILIVLLLLFLCTLGHASKAYTPTYSDPFVESWRWQKFPELGEWSINSITEDNQGSMWFAGYKVIIKYDGYTWQYFTPEDGIPDQRLHTIICDKNGIIYAASKANVVAYQNGKWEKIFTFPDFITSLKPSQNGGIWIGTNYGVVLFRDKEYKALATRIDIQKFKTIDLEIDAIVLPDHFGVKNSWDIHLGIRFYFNSDIIDSILPGSPLDNKGLYSGDEIISVNQNIDYFSFTISQAEVDETLSFEAKKQGDSTVSKIAIKKVESDKYYSTLNTMGIYEGYDNQLFVSMYRSKIIKLSFDDNSYSKIHDIQIIKDSDPSYIEGELNIIQDADSSIWLATSHTSPLYHFDGKELHSIRLGRLGGSENHINITRSIHGEIIVAGYACIHVYNGQKWRIYRNPQIPTPNSRLKVFSVKNGSIWILGLEGDVYRLDYSHSRWQTFEGLNFQCMMKNGTKWFITRNGEVVQNKDKIWRQYGPNDGLMSTPVALYLTRDESLWAIGSHHHKASIAILKDNRWLKKDFSRLSWGIDYRAVFEDKEGKVWFGSAIDVDLDYHLSGILAYDPGLGTVLEDSAWRYHYPTRNSAPPFPYGIGQAGDGRLFVCGKGVFTFDGRDWETLTSQQDLHTRSSDYIYTTKDGELWFASRGFGVYHYNGESWNHYTAKDGLAANSISSIVSDNHDNIWCSTINGISRFDGISWIPVAFPSHLKIGRYGGLLKYSNNHAFWVNISFREWYRRGLPPGYAMDKIDQEFKTTKFTPDTIPPITKILIAPKEVSQPGNTFISWQGNDPWRWTPNSELQYSYRIDGQSWSAFSSETNISLLELSPGDHLFEVRSRDSNFNIERDHQAVQFYVQPPLWQKFWFLSFISVIILLITIQSMRIYQRNQKLKESNLALLEANEEIKSTTAEVFKLNEELEDRVKRRTAELETINRELESFSFSISHDLKAPLRSITGFGQILSEDYTNKKLDKEGVELIVKICKNTERMRQLIDDLLAFSRISRQEIQLQSVNMQFIVESVIRELEPTYKDRTIRFQVDPLENVTGDSSMLRQVFINLLSNSIKFTQPKSDACIQINCEQNDSKIIYHVKDNGVGFNMKYSDRLFGVFQRLHGTDEFPGTGIGLSLAHRIITRHKGKIWAKSEVNQGATFSFSLPK